ncbi:hypothetical protein CRUP_014426, partial [Coryphaenoides rupestris]
QASDVPSDQVRLEPDQVRLEPDQVFWGAGPTCSTVSGVEISSPRRSMERWSLDASACGRSSRVEEALLESRSVGKESLGLTHAENYYYLNQSGCVGDNTINDTHSFQEVMFSEEHIGEILRLLAGILHAGNIEFMTAGGAQISSPTGADQRVSGAPCWPRALVRH